MAAAEGVKQSSYADMEAKLVTLLTALFPTVCSINDFASKYVREYFGLWHQITEFYHHWADSLGFESEASKVMARALLRDLILRVCYLESCDRALRGKGLSVYELDLLYHKAPNEVYAAVISDRMRRDKTSLEKLAADVGLYDKRLQRLKKRGKPTWPLLQKLAGSQAKPRLLAGIGFLDVFLRQLKLNQNAMWADIFNYAAVFFPSHRRVLDTMEKGNLAKLAGQGDSLLLHVGFASVWPEVPKALWRAHFYALKFALFDDLTEAYIRFSKPQNENELSRFFEESEQKSNGCPHQWFWDIKASRVSKIERSG